MVENPSPVTAAAEPCSQMRDESCTPLWRKAHLEVKSKNGFRALLEVEMSKKCTPHAVVARSTCRSQKVKRTKHLSFGTLLEVAMSRKCTSLWREAHFEVKSEKTEGERSTFGRSDVDSRGRRKGLWTVSKVSKM